MLIRQALPDDIEQTSALIMRSADEYFRYMYQPSAELFISKLFRKKKAVYSYDLSHVVEIDDKIVAVLISFDNNELTNSVVKFVWTAILTMGWYFFPFIPRMIKSSAMVGNFKKDEYYVSNIAVDKEHLKQGVGKYLLEHAIQIASKKGYKKVVLDVEIEKKPAINLYLKCGFKIEYDINFQYNNKLFQFHRMEKVI